MSPDAFPPLPQAIAEALAPMPAAASVPQYRDQVMAAGGPLARSMARLEDAHAEGRLTAAVAAELLAWAAYLALVRGHRGATTVAQYLDSLSRFTAWLAASEHDHAEVTHATFDAWQKWLRLTLRHGVRWQTAQVAAVRNFYDWRHTRELGANCARDLRAPREHAKPARKYSTPQLQAMLRVVQGYDNETERLRDTALLLFLLASGARREEVTRLDVQDLDFGRNRGMVHLRGKGAKERDVPLEGPVIDALRDWLLHREGLPYLHAHDAVFVAVNGFRHGARMGVAGVEGRIRIAGRQAGLRKGQWGVHRFRVTFATLLYDDGAGIEEIRKLLGHESIETTRRYIDASERARKTRLSSNAQHIALGTRNTSGPRWLDAALGGGLRD